MPTPVFPVPASYDAPVPAATYRWGVASTQPAPVLSFSFPTASSTWDFAGSYTQPGQPTLGFAPLDAALQSAVRSVLASWAKVCGLRFLEVVDDSAGRGDLRYAFTQFGMSSTQLGAAFLPNPSESSGDVWLNASLRFNQFASIEPGGIGHFTVLHETGHALGLRHPETPGAQGGHSVFQSVMSVNAVPGIALSYAGNIDRLPTTPMSWDIDAMQQLYGPPAQGDPVDDLYTFDSDGRYLMTVFDTGGRDTFRVNGNLGARIDLRPGEWSRVGLAVQVENGRYVEPNTVQIYRDSWIEEAVGTEAPDTITGNALANRIEGRGGDDTVDGGAGTDRAVYAGPRAAYVWQQDAGVLQVAPGAAVPSGDVSATGRDTLIDVERLQFRDASVAFDLQSNAAAGRAALLVTGLLGPAALMDHALMGRVIAFFDTGKSLLDATTLLLDIGVISELAGGRDQASIVQLLYRHVTGLAHPTAAQLAPYVGMLENGTVSPAEFVAQAVLVPDLQQRIGLVELALTGLAYTESA